MNASVRISEQRSPAGPMAVPRLATWHSDGRSTQITHFAINILKKFGQLKAVESDI